MKTKYIVYQDLRNSEIEQIVIFSGLDVHKRIARGLGMIVSAGFIDIGEGARCYGVSESLGVESRVIDTQIARWALGWDEHPRWALGWDEHPGKSDQQQSPPK